MNDRRMHTYRMVSCIEDPDTGYHYAHLVPRYDGPLPAMLVIEGEPWKAVGLHRDGSVLLRRPDDV